MEIEGAPRRSRRLVNKQATSFGTNTRSTKRLTTTPTVLISGSEDDDYVDLSPKAPQNTPRKNQVSPVKLKSPSRKSHVVPTKITITISPLKDPPSKDNKINENILLKDSPVKNLQMDTPFKEESRTPRKTKSNSDGDTLVTPPKIRKTDSKNDENSPCSPPRTPSVLLERFSLIDLGEKVVKSNRKKLFDENDLYKNARRALHSTCPTNMPGREKELKELQDFICQHVTEGSSGTMYISGPPGTGKTASLNLILEDENISKEIRKVYVNCTSIKSSGSIFSRIVKDLGVKTNAKTEKDNINVIEKFLQKSQKSVLLVLDEIDQLESKKQSVLYTIFEWPAQPNYRLILIGIANALDLTDRILPRLQARCELKPLLMHFPPYTKQQIVEIFTNRLKNAGVIDIFSPVALQMLAGKVAAVSGDVRRALDIGRRVIELVDKKKKDECVLKSVENLAQELNDDTEKKKLETVDLGQVVKVLNNVYGTTQNLNEDDDAFPLQQKIIICSLLLILNKAKNRDVTIGRLHEVYRKVCTKRNIQAVDQGEFVGLCSLIETRGIIRIIKKKDPRLSKISLIWDQEEVGDVLKDKQLMSMILQDDSCLGRL